MHLPVLLTVFYLLSPAVLIYLCRKYVVFERIGTILLAYGIGLLIANIGVLPAPSGQLKTMLIEHAGLNIEAVRQMVASGELPQSDLLYFRINKLQNLFTIITIPLALPLLLFAADIHAFSKMAGKAFLSMGLALFAVVLIVVSGFFIFQNLIEDDLWKISGLMIGLYSGGTPNLAAIKMALNVSSETYIITHTYDTIVSAAYLFFLITIGEKFFRQLLPPYRFAGQENGSDENDKNFTFKHKLFSKKGFFKHGKAILISVVIFGVSGAFTLLFPAKLEMLVVILSITTLSILVSSYSKIKITSDSFHIGMYFILVFSVVVASMADISIITNVSSALFYYIVYAIFFSLFLHVLLAYFFKIDSDTVMVTSSALICSPPFVPMIAGAINNKEVIVSGLTVGIVGYAIGNYLGVGVAYLLRGLMV
ncbi:MAG: DUF819 family protein [Bacteroidota bacterium]